jgi:sugar/nucleoside kinase (ribokinase family)
VRPVAVVGNLSRDRVDGGPPRVGGSPYYAGRALRLVGCRGVVVTKCAEADRAALLPPLVALGLPVKWRPSSATAAFAFRYENGTRVMSIEALGEPWSPDDVRGWVGEALRRVEWIHLGALARSDVSAETLAALARGGRRISLDGQGLVRPSRTGPLELDDGFERELLRHVSVLKLAEEEARVLLGGEPGRAALRALRVPEVVITLGPRGSLVFAEGRLEQVAARPVERADPTGAGDAYAAAYIAGRNAGQPPVAAARRATAFVAALLSGESR